MAGKKYEFKDFDGEQFGEWKVIGCKRNSHFWLICENNDGEIKQIRANKLISFVGGKFKDYKIKKQKHGLRGHKLYNKWDSIKQRCTNSNFRQNIDYSTRGITICDEWKDDFLAFYNWAINNGYKEHLEIDRIDNDGNYEPNNCRFVTHTENNHNTRLLTKQNTSGYRGVSFNKFENKYQVQIKHNKKVIANKKFNNSFCAAIWRDKYIIGNNLPHMLNFPKLRLVYERKANNKRS